jgi:hypothetical protein
MFLRNIGLSPNYTALLLTRPYSSSDGVPFCNIDMSLVVRSLIVASTANNNQLQCPEAEFTSRNRIELIVGLIYHSCAKLYTANPFLSEASSPVLPSSPRATRFITSVKFLGSKLSSSSFWFESHMEDYSVLARHQTIFSIPFRSSCSQRHGTSGSAYSPPVLGPFYILKLIITFRELIVNYC